MNYNKTMQMGHLFRLILGVMFLVVLGACGVPADEHLITDISQTATKMNMDSPIITELANQNWMIFTKGDAEEMGIASWLVNSDDFWTPSANDILKLEENIAAYLSQNSNELYRQPPVWERLDEYQRQYIGLERNGSQIIYGNYFCNSIGVNWRQRVVVVEDGGDCYFQVEYDVESGLFTKLWVNGES